jgi:crotonobetainyl-CoA:carnitine CoA-transferase CaiB-like acyl-CoA transferase
VAARGANWDAMMQVVERWTAQHSVDECLTALDRAGIPSARFRDPADTLHDPHLAERGVFADVADTAGAFKGVNAPWRMSGARTGIGHDIPAIGEHRDEILARVLGWSASEVSQAAAAGAFGKLAAAP